jgi:hypothetical protein
VSRIRDGGFVESTLLKGLDSRQNGVNSRGALVGEGGGKDQGKLCNSR